MHVVSFSAPVHGSASFVLASSLGQRLWPYTVPEPCKATTSGLIFGIHRCNTAVSVRAGLKEHHSCRFDEQRCHRRGRGKNSKADSIDSSEVGHSELICHRAFMIGAKSENAFGVGVHPAADSFRQADISSRWQAATPSSRRNCQQNFLETRAIVG